MGKAVWSKDSPDPARAKKLEAMGSGHQRLTRLPVNTSHLYTLPHELSQTQNLPGLGLCGQNTHICHGVRGVGARLEHARKTHTHAESVRPGFLCSFAPEHTNTIIHT